MAQIIQIKRRVPGTGKPAAGTGAGQVTAGELATSISAVAAAAVAELYVGDGSFVHDLVSAARQVEIDGAQTINGAKTIGAAGSLTTPVANLHVQGGNAGDILATNGAGVHSWISLPAAGIPSFTTTGTYAVGAFVSYGGHLYRAVAANGPGAWDPADWDRVATLGDTPAIDIGTTAPTPAAAGDLWFNTTTQQLMAYNGTAWVLASRAYIGTTAPATPALGTTWFDTNSGQNLLKVWNGTAWLPAVDVPIQDFSAAQTYVVGDIVIHAGHIYRAVAANGPGAWDGDDWDQISGTGVESLEVKAPISGNGLTALTALGVTMATTAQVDAGTDTTYPISSAVLKSQIIGGLNGVASLATTNKLVVPAINELHTEIAAISGGLHLVGTYDVPGDEITAVAGHEPLDTQALPAAAPGNEGWYVIVTAGGTGINNAPHVTIAAGDWIVSTGSAWVHLPLFHAAITAANVGLTTVDSQSWTNVQQAVQGLLTRFNTAGNAAVLADHVSILGDGTSATETALVGTLRVGTVDGGAY